MVAPYDPKRPFILLTAEQATKVRGARIAPAQTDDATYIIADSALIDPKNADVIPYLMTLPRCALVSPTQIKRNSIRPAANLPKPPPAKPKDGTNPWDRTVLPARGDWSEGALYESIGRALSKWESFEAAFGNLFLALLSPNFYSLPALRAYGSVITFNGRTDMMKAAAEARFAIDRGPAKSQTEKDFDTLMKLAERHSPRRNEIAHGVVGPYLVPPQKVSGLALMPSEHSRRHRELRSDVDLAAIGDFFRQPTPAHLRIDPGDKHRTIPAYAYTTLEIDHFGSLFAKLSAQTQEYADLIHLPIFQGPPPPPGSLHQRMIVRRKKPFRSGRKRKR